MRRYNLLVFLTLMTVAAQAQFINNGAIVTIQSGATLRVETNIENNGAGTITNNGTIEVTGNFTNAGTAALTPGVGLVKFIGSANTTLDTGGDALFNVEMAKTGNATVALSAPATIAGSLSFTGAGSKILLGANDLTLTKPISLPADDPVSATTNHATNGYAVTNDAGKIIKSVGAGSINVDMEIGDATNYTPVAVSMTGNASGNVSSRVITSSLSPKYDDASDKLNREWIVSTPTVTSTLLTGTYIAAPSADVTGTQSLIKGCTYLGSNNWSFAGSTGTGNTVVASTTSISDVKLSGQNFFGKATLKAYLAGALPSGTTMSTNLNAILPTTESPYAAAPFSAPSLAGKNIVKPVNATDWILIEVRDPVTPSTVTSKISGWILNDGSIVSYDNTPLRLKDVAATGHIAIKHRNHLGVRTNSSINLDGSALVQNFANPSASGGEVHNVYVDPIAVANNPNMKTVGSFRALWSGNANNDDRIKYSGSGTDVNAISSAVFTNPLNVTFSSTFPLIGYHIADLNMNGEVKYSGSGTDITIISANVLTNPTNLSFSSTFPIIKHLEN